MVKVTPKVREDDLNTRGRGPSKGYFTKAPLRSYLEKEALTGQEGWSEIICQVEKPWRP